MYELAVFWPWPWWTAAVACVAIVLAAWVTGRASLISGNRRSAVLGRQLRDAGLSSDDAYVLMGQSNAVVVSGNLFAIVDTRESRIVQTLAFDCTVGLKIYEGAEDSIGFRIVGRNGSQSRKLLTRSTPEFAQLFGMMAAGAKRIDYIQE